MSDTNADPDGGEPSKAELHDRVEKLESTVEKLMPSRRDALRMGAAGIAGAAGLGAASQSAEASTGSAGTIGSNSDRPDLVSDIVDANTVRGTKEFPASGIEATFSTFTTSTGFNKLVRYDHKGNGGEIALADIRYVGTDVGASTTVSNDALGFVSRSPSQTSWGSTGATTTISNNVRFRVDSNDSTVLYLEANVPSSFFAGLIHVRVSTRSADTELLLGGDFNSA